MSILRCEKGHFYNTAKTPECPICNQNQVQTPRRMVESVQPNMQEANSLVSEPILPITAESKDSMIAGLTLSADAEPIIPVTPEERISEILEKEIMSRTKERFEDSGIRTECATLSIEDPKTELAEE